MMAASIGSSQLNTRSWQERLAERDPSLRVHLIGIGGAGLSAIARTLLEMGMAVSGSDMRATSVTQSLAEAGARIYAQQTAANVEQMPELLLPDVVLISSAVRDSNAELIACREAGLPVTKRDAFLSALLARRKVIAIAGAHGKSTTTSMIISVLRDAGLDPGFIVGAELPGLGNAGAGNGELFVIEADEYDRMFLGLSPVVAVITNVEWDHPDCYPTPASFRKAFMQFVDRVDRDGLIVSCMDDEGAEAIRAYAQSRGPQWITYGFDSSADVRATPTQSTGADVSAPNTADLTWWSAPAGQLRLRIPGAHNVRNALAALVVSTWCDVPTAEALRSLGEYRGVGRRFELKGTSASGVDVYDDYAHHPTEIRSTLAAARQRYPQQRIWAVFQPHTFSRTQRMLYRMGESFQDADEVLVTDIYAAREADDRNVSSAELVAASPHPSIRYISALDDVARYLREHCARGDVVITLGAGDVNHVGDILLRQGSE
ncbi:MAG: UDP-N-acetylmuramate--L-alanine ligase [Caldilineaceae bacterium]